jgi:hypothetical protein
MATFSKFINIFCPNSNKKVIGFDIFDHDHKDDILNKDSMIDKIAMNTVYSRVNTSDLSLESVETRLLNMNLDRKHMLIKGDVETTLPSFLEENPGFRTALIYIDVDLERPTYNALKYLWDRLLPGGIIVFDDYNFGNIKNVVDYYVQRNIISKYDVDIIDTNLHYIYKIW